MCVCHSKTFEPQPERKTKAKHFCCGNTQPLQIKLKKLNQISVLISMQVKCIKKWEVCDKCKIWVALWTTLIYIRLKFDAKSILICKIFTLIYAQNAEHGHNIFKV